MEHHFPGKVRRGQVGPQVCGLLCKSFLNISINCESLEVGIFELTVHRWVKDDELGPDLRDLLALQDRDEAAEMLEIERVRGRGIVLVLLGDLVPNHGAVEARVVRMRLDHKVPQVLWIRNT